MMEHWDALLPGRILHVPYEALVAGQEEWSRRMLQHCGLFWDDAVLHFHTTQRDVHTASVSQVRLLLLLGYVYTPQMRVMQCRQLLRSSTVMGTNVSCDTNEYLMN